MRIEEMLMGARMLLLEVEEEAPWVGKSLSGRAKAVAKLRGARDLLTRTLEQNRSADCGCPGEAKGSKTVRPMAVWHKVLLQREEMLQAGVGVGLFVRRRHNPGGMLVREGSPTLLSREEIAALKEAGYSKAQIMVLQRQRARAYIHANPTTPAEMSCALMQDHVRHGQMPKPEKGDPLYDCDCGASCPIP